METDVIMLHRNLQSIHVGIVRLDSFRISTTVTSGTSAAVRHGSSTQETCAARVARVASMQTFLTTTMPMLKGAGAAGTRGYNMIMNYDTIMYNYRYCRMP